MTPSKNKIVSQSVAQDLVGRWKKEQKKVVFTNGCFDIIHLGHIDYLEKARMLGDKLVLGLNSDNSVKKLKGPSRPINDLSTRARILAALQFVDAVVAFEEDTPLELIKQLLPNVLVKGGDYELSNIVGAEIVLENGGLVETIEIVSGYSTTSLIDKLKK